MQCPDYSKARYLGIILYTFVTQRVLLTILRIEFFYLYPEILVCIINVMVKPTAHLQVLYTSRTMILELVLIPES